MTKQKPTLLVLAAGMGSRYGGLKQIDGLGPSGETIIDYAVYDAMKAGFGRVVFIIRKSIEESFREAFKDKFLDKVDVSFVYQELDILPEGFTVPEGREKPWGTAHAVLMAKDAIKEPFAVINADDFYGYEAFDAAAQFLTLEDEGHENTYCMVGYPVKNTLSEHGAVSRGVCEVSENNFLNDVVERTHIERKSSDIFYKNGQGSDVKLDEDSLVSMNFWGFTPSVFRFMEDEFTAFLKEKGNEPKSEFYIPTVVNELVKKNVASCKVLSSGARWFGVTYREDREKVVNEIKELVNKGVYPENLWG